MDFGENLFLINSVHPQLFSVLQMFKNKNLCIFELVFPIQILEFNSDS